MKGRPASWRVSTQENFIITVSWPYLPAGEEKEQNETLIDFFFHSCSPRRPSRTEKCSLSAAFTPWPMASGRTLGSLEEVC